MKRTAKLAFDMLENEMERITAKEQKRYKGGTGGSSGSGGFWLVTGSGIWNTDYGDYFASNSSGSGTSGSGYYGSGYGYGSGYYSSGYYGSGTYGSGYYSSGYYGSGYGSGYYSSGYYGSGYGSGTYDSGYSGSGYGSGTYDSGYYGSGAYGTADPGQIINSYINAHGGWKNWEGGFIPGYGYVGGTYTYNAQSGNNGLMDGIEAGISALCTSAGLTASMTSAICSAAYGKEWTSLSFKSVSGVLKIVGHVSGIGDIVLNAGEIFSGNQTAAQNLEDLGQIVVGVIGLAADITGVGAEVGFAIQLGVTGWEVEEMADGR